MSEYLLVHGGFGVGWVWDDVAKRLETAGHRVHVVDHMSVGTDPASLGDLTADASYVRQTLDAINKPIVLVGHSYSGMVITEFADHPKVRHTVYLTAMWPERSQSGVEFGGGCAAARVYSAERRRAFEITNDFEFAGKSFCPDLGPGPRSGGARALCAAVRFLLRGFEHGAGSATAFDLRDCCPRDRRLGGCSGSVGGAGMILSFDCQPTTCCSFRIPTSWPRPSDESDRKMLLGVDG